MDDTNKRIKLLRDSLNLSQEGFGNAIGLSKSGISSIENGARNVTNKHIKLINNEFNVTEEWLRYGEGDMFENVPKDELDRLAARYKLQPLAKRIVECFVTLEESEMDAVLKLVRNVTDSANDETSATKEDYINKELEDYRLELEAKQKGETLSALEKLRGNIG